MGKKRILFIGVGFHEYDSHIIKHLKRDYDVYYFCSSQFKIKHPHLFLLSQKYGKFLPDYNNKQILCNIEKTKEKDFNYIFAIKGSNLTDNHLSLLKKYHPRAKFSLYFWDSWDVMKNLEILKRYFDAIYSFDSEDCKKLGFKLRPLFYLENKNTDEKKYDICFVGAEHSDRFSSMKELKLLCDNNALKYYIKVIMSLSHYIKVFISPYSFFRYRQLASYKYLSYSEFVKVLRKSKVVIDIHNRRQTGLTMRTIEALASGAKVITTNEYIKEYENIPTYMYYIWDQKVDMQLIDFIKKPVSDYVIDEYYSVDSFLKEVLE